MWPDNSPLALFDATPVGSWIAVTVVVGLLFFVANIALIGEAIGRLIGGLLASVLAAGFVAATVVGACCFGGLVVLVLIVISIFVYRDSRN